MQLLEGVVIRACIEPRSLMKCPLMERKQKSCRDIFLTKWNQSSFTSHQLKISFIVNMVQKLWIDACNWNYLLGRKTDPCLFIHALKKSFRLFTRIRKQQTGFLDGIWRLGHVPSVPPLMIPLCGWRAESINRITFGRSKIAKSVSGGPMETNIGHPTDDFVPGLWL